MDDEFRQTRRRTPTEVTTRRAARQLVGSIEDQIGLWQAEAIKFQAMVDRGGPHPELEAAILARLEAIVAERQSLERAIDDAPETVRRHTRVTDTQKVLHMLEERLVKLKGRS
jgi:hypothetical protein